MKFLSLLIHNQVTKGFWTPIPITSHDPFISHTLFEDDVFLFAEAISQYTKVILHVLEDFTHHSGLHINYTKSKNLFSKNCLNTIQSNITNILAIKQTSSLENYLGFPLLQRAPKHSNFSPILMALNAKMTNWKTKIPTMAGRLPLLRLFYPQFQHTSCNVTISIQKPPTLLIKHFEISFGAHLIKGEESISYIGTLLLFQGN